MLIHSQTEEISGFFISVIIDSNVVMQVACHPTIKQAEQAILEYFNSPEERIKYFTEGKIYFNNFDNLRGWLDRIPTVDAQIVFFSQENWK
jgi:hypothetical protein